MKLINIRYESQCNTIINAVGGRYSFLLKMTSVESFEKDLFSHFAGYIDFKTYSTSWFAHVMKAIPCKQLASCLFLHLTDNNEIKSKNSTGLFKDDQCIAQFHNEKKYLLVLTLHTSQKNHYNKQICKNRSFGS